MGLYQDIKDKQELFDAVGKRLGPEKAVLIEKAYHIADKMHEGQKRLSGEPYIIHPMNVASVLDELGLDERAIAAGLLHDVVEDTSYTKEDMAREFGEDIAALVEGVTKISEIKSQSKETEAAENIRKMLLATIKDVRVMLIKLADKTHNVRTLKFQPEEKQKRIAKEVLSLYAPIAGRLGVYKVKFELEDLAFQSLHPEEYQEIKKRVSAKKSERDEYIEKIKIILKQRLAEISIDARIEGRAKHFYSIYRKMVTKEKSFSEIFDLRAVRIITNEIKDCYGVLGIVHTLWTPIPGRFKDYIATPKTNLYQSLHTTVFGPDGRPMEVQIRTKDMNAIAENGVAAHWAYKESTNLSRTSVILQNGVENAFRMKWLEILKSWQDPSLDSKEFMEELQYDLHEDEVFVFTPKGEIIEMPKGATVLDYAFRIHTDVGLHARGGKVNGRMVTLRTELKSGDQVEIITEKNSKPSPIWLRIVKTSGARQKLRAYFRKLQEDSQRETIGSVLEAQTPAIDENTIKEIKKVKIKKPHKTNPHQEDSKEFGISVAGWNDVPVRVASCCTPIPGDEIIGFITRGRGVSVHKKDCTTASKQLEWMKTIPVRWEGPGEPIPIQIEVRAKDVQGIYLSMVESISSTETNILEAGASSHPNGTLTAKFMLEVDHLDQLKEILENLRMIQGVVFAERVKK
ncbi:bifunctional (p)ppGpp synthetase/guanosine-3',5'-bis(diphosphate) 3'-pyrophosphohydrolase [Leptospira sp. 2 VSF19]|uniref:Bifunctional (P)ppGpp synthetase/guanosine-3',5'-bis(Diphosphate) 3'-pyrophosphohydrolase n=1 Tax=Leptospira soteropolitanensis TaxID=2950025 RepID=A0AAW5VJL2_9LEPT|nr:bifunctional (p)ppGpp synthetase/guanosine-3',5'-bis(diphosphate) 3'-pyrophosphohydrolase [Leptospira soteropolitanensis]MCW7493746.1 bifunctional (p)ppGpp synthetase/guanosine-3',5'-bis(diphosphate) 3'-pyrophosphohydrolase [Leptospira soteropolitanensis]MCW7501344.1 bifunctional (p)ppGpp synthetase/guanosine-3',5'-bis(diphosphate) 3'-pyrophosphohydrolase [Leptospira soteropolitanensis]MCW7523470.1 bifunctional (p)ppGpp synthetase/guanosine-3',5'-bis(diphosphate) 3'-pyrophosphohydrolase [Lept